MKLVETRELIDQLNGSFHQEFSRTLGGNYLFLSNWLLVFLLLMLLMLLLILLLSKTERLEGGIFSSSINKICCAQYCAGITGTAAGNSHPFGEIAH